MIKDLKYLFEHDTAVKSMKCPFGLLFQNFSFRVEAEKQCMYEKFSDPDVCYPPCCRIILYLYCQSIRALTLNEKNCNVKDISHNVNCVLKCFRLSEQDSEYFLRYLELNNVIIISWNLDIVSKGPNIDQFVKNLNEEHCKELLNMLFSAQNDLRLTFDIDVTYAIAKWQANGMATKHCDYKSLNIVCHKPVKLYYGSMVDVDIIMGISKGYWDCKIVFESLGVKAKVIHLNEYYCRRLTSCEMNNFRSNVLHVATKMQNLTVNPCSNVDSCVIFGEDKVNYFNVHGDSYFYENENSKNNKCVELKIKDDGTHSLQLTPLLNCVKAATRRVNDIIVRGATLFCLYVNYFSFNSESRTQLLREKSLKLLIGCVMQKNYGDCSLVLILLINFYRVFFPFFQQFIVTVHDGKASFPIEIYDKMFFTEKTGDVRMDDNDDDGGDTSGENETKYNCVWSKCLSVAVMMSSIEIAYFVEACVKYLIEKYKD